MNTEWMARGKCKEVAPDIFFPSDGMGVLVAQRICAECPVLRAVPGVRAREPHRPRRVGRMPRSVSAAGSCAGVGFPTPSSQVALRPERRAPTRTEPGARLPPVPGRARRAVRATLAR